jgi:class 3 adenylate cyclase/tetratricopeptide (TPR) repeat protein
MDNATGDSPTVTSAALPGTGRLIAGRYEVRARLGRGAWKEVYLAYDARLDREIALAIVVGAQDDAVARARVAREAQVTGRLGDHPNVVTVYDTGEYDGLPYLVLRAMRGGSLADLLQRGAPGIADVARIGTQLAAGLAHAHGHGVVHRDVKPDNVWLAADGTAALGDFGIAHVVDADRLTAEGVVVGTVRYLSPEQIRGEEAGPASDLYALGVTLYELVTGRPPFTAKDATLVLTQHLTSVPVAPSEHAPAIAPELEALILDLLAKDAALRPPSADAVVARLAQIATTAAAQAQPAMAAVPASQTDSRRVVSVLAARADVADPEALHGVFDRCADVIEQHGGTVERYLGDVLVGFFGLDQSHGDDALRAARAAIELRSESSELRLGIESGEVFLATGPRGATMATGATITAAGRLAERAGEGEILLGRQIRPAVAADASIDDETGRLDGLRLEQPALLRAPETPFVGRACELGALRSALADVRARRVCRLVTVTGPPGIGKSRLAGEFLGELGDDTTVLAGRCLAYGEGTTYRALAELVRGLGADPRARVEELLAGDEPAVRGILSAIGLSDEGAQAEETSWALRRLLERLARDRPLVVAVEDIHWAEPALLDLLDHVASLSTGVPILLLCLTRPELIASHPAWSAPEPNRSILVLDALGGGEAEELAARLGAGERAGQIATRAEGNPLFVEQLVAVGGEAGQATSELPASIQAVLAARIDRLDQAERSLLQRASVEGRTFHASALAAVLPEAERRRMRARFAALARQGLIGAEPAVFEGESAYRFTHALIREAAYAGLPKLVRADLHAAVAQWLESRPAAEDEIVAYHLEQACQLAAGLGRTGEREAALRPRAVTRLQSASRAALTRGDPGAASRLLERAIALPAPDEEERTELLPALGATLYEAGRMTDATRVLDEAIEQAPREPLDARARVEREFVRLETDAGAGIERARSAADAALTVFRRTRDGYGEYRAWSLHAQAAWTAGEVQRADAAWVSAAECARRAGDERDLFDVLGWRAPAAVLGPTPVDEAIARCEEFRRIVIASPVATMWMLNPLALLHAMKGDFTLADRLLEEAAHTRRQLGGPDYSVSHMAADVQLLADRPDLAAIPLRMGIEKLSSMGDGRLLATTTAMLARAVYAQGDLVEAHALCRQTAAGAAVDDIITQVMWRCVEARILAADGRPDEGERLAHEAIDLVAPTDLLSHKGDAMLALAEVHRASGRDDDQARVRAALAMYAAKGNLTAAARARRLLRGTEP